MILINFIFLGFLLTAVIGLIATWFDRKITARIQYRVGPPLLQPFIDIVKLFGKETLMPEGASKIVFFVSPVLGLISIIIVSTILWNAIINTNKTFLGDLIVVLYFLTIPSLSIILGGFASKNPLASIGASREMKLVIAYELPFILSVLVSVIKSNLSIRIGDIIKYQIAHGSIIGSWSGILSFFVVFFCVQAKLGLVPFDVAEAETELASGALIEYSGVSLAIYRLTKAMMFFVLPFFMIILFCSGQIFVSLGILKFILIYIAIVTLIVIIRNVNPRLRIDQALRFFWGPMTFLSIVATILAMRGL